jgi:hypothetical protein
LRYLYERLVRYFPQLTADDLSQKTGSGRSPWHRVIQRAGRQLIDKGELRRERNIWALTPKGRRRVQEEAMRVAPPSSEPSSVRMVSHKEAQQMLVEIGLLLGRHAEAEFDRYDVVWRDSPQSPRLSHVFEVQVSGSVDSALTRLKQAYDAQRSRPFLVIFDERDASFAGRRLTGSFHEMWEEVTVIGLGELSRLYESLKANAPLLESLIANG